jgi:hypothetical protein
MWSAKQSAALDPDYRRRLAQRLGGLACDPADAPYIARRLVGSLVDIYPSRLAALGDQLELVRNRMKAGLERPDECKGVAGFTENDWRALEAIKPIEPASADH